MFTLFAFVFMSGFVVITVLTGMNLKKFATFFAMHIFTLMALPVAFYLTTYIKTPVKSLSDMVIWMICFSFVVLTQSFWYYLRTKTASVNLTIILIVITNVVEASVLSSMHKILNVIDIEFLFKYSLSGLSAVIIAVSLIYFITGRDLQKLKTLILMNVFSLSVFILIFILPYTQIDENISYSENKKIFLSVVPLMQIVWFYLKAQPFTLPRTVITVILMNAAELFITLYLLHCMGYSLVL
jgi:hypothetical protein